MADAVLTVLRSVATWVARRDDAYAPPFIKGMNRVSAKERKRTRILEAKLSEPERLNGREACRNTTC
jgi:hypothetical protein